MAQLTNIPGFIGFEAKRISSFDGRAIGKLQDTNHLYSLHQLAPSEYDKKVITLYTQTAQYSNDFLDMINQSSIYYPTTDYWSWEVGVPYQFATIVDIPQSTMSMSTPGINGQMFEIVLDRKAFYIHDVITANRQFGQSFYIINDPEPDMMGWKYKCSLVSTNPLTEYVNSIWLRPGIQYTRTDTLIGEFDQELSGLPDLGQKITLYDSLSAAYGVQDTVTKWASQMSQVDAKGNPLNVMVYTKYMINEVGKPQVLDMKWESFIEQQMRKWMLDTKVTRFIWNKPGTARSGGDRQEIKKAAEGLYWKIRNHGNYASYNRGDFSINLMRNMFGDLFYRRVDIQDRRVKVYTNEAGMEVFNTALKKDAMGSGLVFNVGDNDKFVSGKGQELQLNFNFNKVYTLDTGTIELVHLKELDQPQTNSEFGQNKKSTPIFFVFDISPEGDGTPKNNIREVRLKGAPSMTWGMINGRQNWYGFQASQGMISSSMSPTTTLWMEDRCDLFVEDLSRMCLIEEIPQF